MCVYIFLFFSRLYASAFGVCRGYYAISRDVIQQWNTSRIIFHRLTHWGHICVDNLTIFGSDNGLSPGRRQAIIWIHAGILLIGLLGTNFSETLIDTHTFSFKKMRLKMSSAKCRSSCRGLNELTQRKIHRRGRRTKDPKCCRNILKTYFQLKSHGIYFVHSTHFSCQNVLKFYIAHRDDTKKQVSCKRNII